VLAEAIAASQTPPLLLPHAFSVSSFIGLAHVAQFPGRTDLTDFLLHGFDLGYKGALQPRRCKNLEIHDPKFLADYITEELAAGRIQKVSPALATTILFSPIGCVPKPSLPGLPPKWRVIHHLSYPRRSTTLQSVNSCLQALPYKITAMDDLLLWIRSLGPGCFLAKSDACSAFRQCAVRPDQRWLLGFSFGNDCYVDCVLPMGSTSSPARWELVASAVVWIAKHFGGKWITVYVDDFLFVDESEEACNGSLDVFLDICRRCGVRISLNKTFRATQQLEILGILFDTTAFTLSLTPAKISKTLLKLQHGLSQPYSASQMESIAGSLLWISGVILQGKAFTMDLLQLIRQTPPNTTELPTPMKSVLRWWHQCLSTAPIPARPIAIPTTDFGLQLCSDASGLGIGGHFLGSFFSFDWHQVHQTWPWTKDFRSINEKELLAVMVSVAFWAPSWPKGCSVAFRCDNMSSVRWHTRASSPTPLATEMLKWLFLFTARLGVSIKLLHLAGINNVYADALSRLKVQLFKKLYKDQFSGPLQAHQQLPNSIPTCLPLLPSSI
jgi:hypothetical protein